MPPASPSRSVAPAAPGEARTHADARAHTYATLDGLRGVAAFSVVIYHFRSDFFSVHGYLAVDLFFAMSGFVVASAYERRLSGGLGPKDLLGLRDFLGIRLRRLAPLWVLGVVVGLALVLAIPSSEPPQTWVLLALPALLLVPHGMTLTGAFPMNTSLWSLHVEMVVNFAYGWTVRRLTTPVLIGVAAASFALLSVLAYGQGAVSNGTSNLDLACGYLRALTTFPAGVVLWRLRDRLPKLAVSAPLVLFAAMLLMTGLGAPTSGVLGVTYDLAFIVLAVPALVVAAVGREPTARLRPLFARLGSGSYALYALHEPIVLAARRVASHHGGLGAYTAFGLVLIPALVLLAWTADRLFDAPLQRRLKVRAGGSSPSTRPQAAAVTP